MKKDDEIYAKMTQDRIDYNLWEFIMLFYRFRTAEITDTQIHMFIACTKHCNTSQNPQAYAH